MTVQNFLIEDLKKFWKEYKFPILLGFTYIGALYVVVFLGLVMTASPDALKNNPNLNLLTSGWLRWDYPWYRQIAEIGYKLPADFSSIYDIKAFFPFYPLLIRIFNVFTHNYETAALLISNVAFILSLIILYTLTKQKSGVSVADKTLIILCAFPFSFYFVAAYTESVFLLLALAAFYFGEKQKWLYASIMAAFAGATKAMGILVTASLIFQYLDRVNFQTKLIKKDILWLTLGFGGLAGYMVYLARNFGDPFAFISAEFTWLGQNKAVDTIISMINSWVSGSWQINYGLLHITIQLMVTIFFLFLIIKLFRDKSISKSYFVYSLLMFLASLINWYGMGRYVIVIFPVFIIFAKFFKSDKALFFISFLFILLQSLFAFMFSHSFWVA